MRLQVGIKNLQKKKDKYIEILKEEFGFRKLGAQNKFRISWIYGGKGSKGIFPRYRMINIHIRQQIPDVFGSIRWWYREWKDPDWWKSNDDEE